MKNLITAVCVSISFLGFAGCASESTIVDAGQESGLSQTFTAASVDVLRATQVTLADLGLSMRETIVSDGTTTLIFSKPVSAFSWGEVGKIVIADESLGTTVTVVSSKRYAIQITGTTQASFATQIFTGIARNL